MGALTLIRCKCISLFQTHQINHSVNCQREYVWTNLILKVNHLTQGFYMNNLSVLQKYKLLYDIYYY